MEDDSTITSYALNLMVWRIGGIINLNLFSKVGWQCERKSEYN